MTNLVEIESKVVIKRLLVHNRSNFLTLAMLRVESHVTTIGGKVCLKVSYYSSCGSHCCLRVGDG